MCQPIDDRRRDLDSTSLPTILRTKPHPGPDACGPDLDLGVAAGRLIKTTDNLISFDAPFPSIDIGHEGVALH